MTLTDTDIKMIYSYKNFALSLTLNEEDAEDLLHDVVVGIVRNVVSFASLPAGEKRAYTIASIRNKQIDKVRRKQAKGGYKCELSNHVVDTRYSAQPDIYGKLELEEVMKAGDGKEICDTLFLYASGYTMREIAEMKKLSLNTALGHNRYARKFLKNAQL